MDGDARSGFKTSPQSNLGVGREIQILEILEYSSGSNVASALTLRPIEAFETTSLFFN
jgi:hypothetical protein